MPDTQFFGRKHPTDAVKKRGKERLNSLNGVAVWCSTKEMHLTQCSVSPSSKGSSKRLISECCPNKAPQCKRMKYPWRTKV